MAERTAIEWTDATFNPWWGCARVSPACARCYADVLARRYGHALWGPMAAAFFCDRIGLIRGPWNREASRRGRIRSVFCASMADVFEDAASSSPGAAPLVPASRRRRGSTGSS